jgi:hypothetical protein
MKRFVFALLLIGCGSDPAPEVEVREDKVVALDLLGLLHPDFPCEKYLEQIEGADEFHLGYLAGGTFGESRHCLGKLLDDGLITSIRLHVCNGSCITNNRCHASECFAGLRWSDDDQLLVRLEQFAEREFSWCAASQCRDRLRYVSPFLEHQASAEVVDRAADILYRLAREYGLEIDIVDNPLFPRPSEYLLEVHNEFASPQFPYIFSTDGYFGPNPGRLISQNESAEIRFLWRQEMNGLCSDGSPWVYPTERRCW